MNNHYENILKQVLNKIKDGRYKKALHTLDKELGMPYMPLTYEQKFVQLRKLCWEKTRQSQKSVRVLKEHEMFKILTTATDPLLNVALSQLNRLNLRALQKPVSKILSNTQVLNIVKVSVWTMLVTQEVNHTFVVKTSFAQRRINPCQDELIFLPNVNARVVARIEALTHQDPTLQKVAKNFLQLYWINLFPCVSDEFGLAEAVVYVGQKSLSHNPSKFVVVNKKKLTEVKTVLGRSGWGQPIYNR